MPVIDITVDHVVKVYEAIPYVLVYEMCLRSGNYDFHRVVLTPNLRSLHN